MSGTLPATTTVGPQSALGLFLADLDGQPDDLNIAVTPQLPTTDAMPYRREYFLSKAEILSLGKPREVPTTYYVTATKLNVRSGPGTTYPIVGQLTEGTAVVVVHSEGNWRQTATGWLSADFLSLVPKASRPA